MQKKSEQFLASLAGYGNNMTLEQRVIFLNLLEDEGMLPPPVSDEYIARIKERQLRDPRFIALAAKGTQPEE
ncbi:hypothetical protein [Methylocucumis oryzae]|nr:hypothetical protein [Methylocucumis oryzae]